MLVFPLWVTDESVQIPDCCFLKEAVWVFFLVCLFVWFFFFFLGEIGKEALICIINFVVLHIFEQPRERNPGTARGSFLTFIFRFNLLNWNYPAPLRVAD